MTLPQDTRGEAASAEFLTIDPGQTELLIVGPAITGYQYWKTEGGPVRQAEVFDEPLPSDVRMKDVTDRSGNVVGQAPEKQQFYWALPVYIFKTKKFGIWQITQKGVREDLLKLQQNPTWGAPEGKYTVTVDKSGIGFQTKYTVMGNPDGLTDAAKKKEITEIMKKYAERPIDVAGDLFGTAE